MNRLAYRKLVNKVMLTLTGVCTVLTVSILFIVFGYLVYNGGAPKYVNTINKVAASGYEGVTFDAPLAARDRQPDSAADQKAAAHAR